MEHVIDYLNRNQSINTVFFDVFDTIIFRDVAPEYTKKIWAKNVMTKLGTQMKDCDLYNIRKRIEAELCNTNSKLGFDLEFQYPTLIFEIYSNLLKQQTISNVGYDYFLDVCTNIEVDTEHSIQFIDEEWIKLVKKLHERGVQIYCVSDIYLSQQMLNRLFELHDIKKYICDILVSSEYLLTKRSGKLYDIALSQFGKQSDSTLMVGDNLHSDYEMAIQKGLHAIHIDRSARHQYYKEYINEMNSINHFSKRLNALIKSRSKKPFDDIVFSLFTFIYKLHKQLISDGVKDIFFLAREGEYLLELFTIYQNFEGIKPEHTNYIRPHYLIVSRKSTFLPSLKSLEQEDFIRLFRQYRKISLFEFLASLGFKDEEITEISLVLAVVDSNATEVDFPTSDTFKKLITSNYFRSKYEFKRSEQKTNFYRYLDEFDVDLLKSGLNIVDVGWKGTIQDNIFHILGEKINITGYYLGLIALGYEHPNNLKKGILFNVIEEKSLYDEIYNQNRAIFEIALGASHGSANEYLIRDNKVEVSTFQNDKEIGIYNNLIRKMQGRMLQEFVKICLLICKTAISYDFIEKRFVKIHTKMVFFPKLSELNFFNGLYHYENFGVFKFTTFTSTEKLSVLKKIVNFFSFISNPHKYLRESFWIPLTLHNLGLSFLMFPYWIYVNRKMGNRGEIK